MFNNKFFKVAGAVAGMSVPFVLAGAAESWRVEREEKKYHDMGYTSERHLHTGPLGNVCRVEVVKGEPLKPSVSLSAAPTK